MQTSAGSHARTAAATVESRAAICVHASTTAAPFRSVPVEAAVADALGTLSVRVGMRRMRSERTPSVPAAICRILVNRPWPISVPPWFTCTLPSRYTSTSALPWL